MTSATTSGTRAAAMRSRHRALSEAEWRRWWATLSESTHTLPHWLRPLPPTTAKSRPTAGSMNGGPGDTLIGSLLDVAVHATTHLELRASCGAHGLLAVFGLADRRDGAVAGLRRELVSVDGGDALQPVPGVQLSGLTVDRWIEAVMRLVPPDREARGRRSVRLPAEQAFALVDGARGSQGAVWQEVATQFGDDQPLGILRSLARGLRGTLDIRIGGPERSGRAFASWLLSDEGWVMVRTRGPEVVHVPVSRSAIRARVLAGLTTSLSRHG